MKIITRAENFYTDTVPNNKDHLHNLFAVTYAFGSYFNQKIDSAFFDLDILFANDTGYSNGDYIQGKHGSYAKAVATSSHRTALLPSQEIWLKFFEWEDKYVRLKNQHIKLVKLSNFLRKFIENNPKAPTEAMSLIDCIECLSRLLQSVCIPSTDTSSDTQTVRAYANYKKYIESNTTALEMFSVFFEEFRTDILIHKLGS